MLDALTSVVKYLWNLLFGDSDKQAQAELRSPKSVNQLLTDQEAQQMKVFDEVFSDQTHDGLNKSNLNKRKKYGAAYSEEFKPIAKRIRAVVDPLATFKTSYNDPIINGRSIKWYGGKLADELNKSKEFDKLAKQLNKEGYSVRVRTLRDRGTNTYGSATRVHVKKKG